MGCPQNNVFACVSLRGRFLSWLASGTERIGICRGAVKLYADFFQSDIIVASPIALATKIAEAEGKTSEEIDFLSSIEVAIAARCDVMQMQNWQHVRTGNVIAAFHSHVGTESC